MTDKEYSAQKSRVEKTFRKWSDPAGMGGWIIVHTWHRDGTSGDNNSNAGEMISTARASVAWQYCHVTFHWNLVQIEDNSDTELDRIVRHEICHVLVAEMRMWGNPTQSERECDEAMMHEERTVTNLAAILSWCRQAGQHDSAQHRKKR